MKISIITVVLNDLTGLKKTVNSVLSQQCVDFEYVILDGGSSDGTWEYIESLKIKGITKQASDTGIYNAMNNAVKLASGIFCLFLNAGDTFVDDFVLLKANEALGDSDLYVGHTVEIGERVIKGMAPNPLTMDYLIRNSIYHQSTFIRRSLLLEHPYNEKHKIVSDWEFFFERWIAGCSYDYLDFFVSNYYLGGFSFVNQELINIERRECLERILPSRILDGTYKGSHDNVISCEGYEQQKISKVMLCSPIQRDLNLIRYGIKFLIKDIFKWK